jgi:hypothetical protein
MNKIYWIIFLLICFLGFQILSFDQRVSKRKASIKSQKTIRNSPNNKPSKNEKSNKAPANQVKKIPETTNVEVDIQEITSNSKLEQIQKFDTLREIEPGMHVEFSPAESIAVGEDKLTPEEQKQYELSLNEINKVKEQGKLITEPKKKDIDNEQ